MTTGEKIKRYRSMMGLTQTELALKVGYTSYSTIAKIENNQSAIPTSKLKKMADVFGVNPADLLNEETDVKSTEQELVEVLESIKRRPEMKALFSLTKNCSSADIQKAIEIINVIKGNQ